VRSLFQKPPSDGRGRVWEGVGAEGIEPPTSSL
jgi:hypothetical protein